MGLFIFIILQLLLEVKSQENATENATSPPPNNGSGLDVMSTLPPLTENSTTPLILNETTEDIDLAVTSSTEIMTDPITIGISNLTTHDSHNYTSSANRDLESTAIMDTTEDASDFPLLTEGLENEKYSNTRMFSFIAVVATGVGIILTGLMGICMYMKTRTPKAERIWIESRRKQQGVHLPVAGSDSSGEEDAVVYSTVNFIKSSSPTPGIAGESMLTQVELNPLYYTILTQPSVSSDGGNVYSQLTVL